MKGKGHICEIIAADVYKHVNRTNLQGHMIWWQRYKLIRRWGKWSMKSIKQNTFTLRESQVSHITIISGTLYMLFNMMFQNEL